YLPSLLLTVLCFAPRCSASAIREHPRPMRSSRCSENNLLLRFSQRFPLVVRPLLRLPALSLLPEHLPAHDALVGAGQLLPLRADLRQHGLRHLLMGPRDGLQPLLCLRKRGESLLNAGAQAANQLLQMRDGNRKWPQSAASFWLDHATDYGSGCRDSRP